MNVVSALKRYLIAGNPSGRDHVESRLFGFPEGQQSQPLEQYFDALRTVYPVGFIAIGNPYGFRMCTRDGSNLFAEKNSFCRSVKQGRACIGMISDFGFLSVVRDSADGRVFLEPLLGGECVVIGSDMVHLFDGMSAVAASGYLASATASDANIRSASEVYLNIVGRKFIAPWQLPRKKG